MLLTHFLAQGPDAGSGSGAAATIFAILASAVIVLGGLAALVRAIWKTATTLRDNTTATTKLTDQMDKLADSVNGPGGLNYLAERIDHLSERIEKLEKAASR